MGSTLTMHILDPGLIPGTTHGPLSTTRNDPEHRAGSNSTVYGKKNPIKKRKEK